MSLDRMCVVSLDYLEEVVNDVTVVGRMRWNVSDGVGDLCFADVSMQFDSKVQPEPWWLPADQAV